MDEPQFLRDAIILLLAAVVAVPLVQRLKVSPVLGYLIAGVIIGPSVLALIDDPEGVRTLAEFGVVFLLFAVGLELSLERLRVMRRYVFGLGLAQVAVTAAVIGVIAWIAGLRPDAAIVVGAGLAFSSTAIVVQMLAERSAITARFGRIAIAVLLFQDLAVVPMLALIPLLGGGEATLGGALALAAVKAAAALAVILLLGPLLLRPVFRAVAFVRNPEMFAAVTLLVVLGTAWVTGLVGLSLPLGAFLAGLMLAESEFRHQVEAEIQPFRGLLLGLFFMTVGMLVDLSLLAEFAWLALGLLLALLLGKAVILALLCRLFGFGSGLILNVGMLLAQGGEFAFVLFTLAMAAGILAPQVGQLLLLVVALSMALTPGLAALGRLVERRAAGGQADIGAIETETGDLRNHVVIAGFGRVGRTVARLLGEAQIQYVALDLSVTTVAQARAGGLPVFYGDGARAEVLKACGTPRAPRRRHPGPRRRGRAGSGGATASATRYRSHRPRPRQCAPRTPAGAGRVRRGDGVA